MTDQTSKLSNRTRHFCPRMNSSLIIIFKPYATGHVIFENSFITQLHSILPQKTIFVKTNASVNFITSRRASQDSRIFFDYSSIQDVAYTAKSNFYSVKLKLHCIPDNSFEWYFVRVFATYTVTRDLQDNLELLRLPV